MATSADRSNEAAEEREKVHAAGFRRHLPKPITPDQLAAAVRELAGRSA